MTSRECEETRQESMERYGFGPEAMKQTRVCPNCGTATTSESQFCAVCGARLPRETLFDLYRSHHHCCPHCGTALEAHDNFCPHCGIRLK